MVPGGAGEGRPSQVFQLSSCHCGRMTSASVPTLREGDRFSEVAAGGLRGEEFVKGKMEGAGIKRHKIKETLGSKEGSALKGKGRSKKSKQPKREKRENRGRKARETRMTLEYQLEEDARKMAMATSHMSAGQIEGVRKE